MASTGTRLRKTFKYLSDAGDSDEAQEALDEDEQDSLIASLQSQSSRQTAFYIPILTYLPLLFTLPLLFSLLTGPSSKNLTLSLLVSITSLLMTSLRARLTFTTSSSLRSNAKQKQPLRPPTSSSSSSSSSSFSTAIPPLWSQIPTPDPDGPLLTTLPYLNALASLISASSGLVLWTRTRTIDTDIHTNLAPLSHLLPALAWLLVEMSLRDTRALETELENLSRLRYGLKGA